MKKRLTIFTPTYNRANVLPGLYKSLCVQSVKDFVWMVIDDGSSDNTSSIVNGWKKDGEIEISYFYQSNSGKMRCHNRAVELCKTELFVCIDSDDVLASPSVVKDTLDFWDYNHLLVSEPNVCGLISYRKSAEVHGYFPKETQLCTLSELYKNGYKGETTIVFKTNLIRLFPFPEIEGEKFITEVIVYDRIDINYTYILHPYYSQICNYYDDGYTKNGWSYLLRNPKGYRMYYNQLLKLKKGSVYYNVKMYIACSLLASDGKTFALATSKWLTFLLFPIGYVEFLKLRKEYLTRFG